MYTVRDREEKTAGVGERERAVCCWWAGGVSVLNSEKETGRVHPSAQQLIGTGISVWALIGHSLDSSGDTCTLVFIDRYLVPQWCVCVLSGFCFCRITVYVHWSFPQGPACMCVMSQGLWRKNKKNSPWLSRSTLKWSRFELPSLTPGCLSFPFHSICCTF